MKQLINYKYKDDEVKFFSSNSEFGSLIPFQGEPPKRAPEYDIEKEIEIEQKVTTSIEEMRNLWERSLKEMSDKGLTFDQLFDDFTSRFK